MAVFISFPFRERNYLEVFLRCEKPTSEDLSTIIRESEVLSGGYYSSMYVKTKAGDLFVAKESRGCLIQFPHNTFNYYVMPFSKETDKEVAEWVCKEWEHLSWTDFHYTPLVAYDGNALQNLDDVCADCRHLRENNIWTQDIHSIVARLLLDSIYEESDSLARKLNMPFQSLQLLSSNIRAGAYTDGAGNITFNARYIFPDADSIRQTIVHELCHSVSPGHGRKFNKAMEEAMLLLGLVPRPCAYSHKLNNYGGPVFPIGIFSPGYAEEHLAFENVRLRGISCLPFEEKISMWRG